MGTTTLFVYIAMLIVLTVFGVYTARLSFKNKFSSKQEWLSNYAQGFSSGMIGAVVAGLALGLVVLAVQTNEGASTQQAELKTELIRQLGSQVSEVAVRAAEELQQHGWMDDGSLQKAELWRANLQGANLRGADLQKGRMIEINLQKASLWGVNLQNAIMFLANLQEADLNGADLRGASLSSANLQGANLRFANLQETRFWGANLQGTRFMEADLQGADLLDAALQGADLLGAVFSPETKLPDGSYWTPETDMTRFTDPTHPDFWRWDNKYSPPYRQNIPITTP